MQVIPLLVFLATCASSAHVPWRSCSNDTLSTHALTPISLQARLEPWNSSLDLLSLTIGHWMDAAHCNQRINAPTTVTVSIRSPGQSTIRQHRATATCPTFAFNKKMSSLYYTISENVTRIYPFSSVHLNIHLEDEVTGLNTCMEATITPELKKATRDILRYAPVSIFLFVLLVGFIRSPRRGAIGGFSTVEDVNAVQAVLPQVADCLHYLQFIFLTGSLSLFYPGFYQPVVSNLDWFSLFSRGMLSRKGRYLGTNHGIYEVNGTYGGTFGIEHMTQIVGAPYTMDVWLNMVLSIVLIAIGAGLLIALSKFFENRRNAHIYTSTWAHLRDTCSSILLVVLSYFMLPLLALSLYQFSKATILPAYHTSLTVAFVSMIMAAFVWLVRQVPVRNLGVLLFDSKKQYRLLSSGKHQKQQHTSFVLTLFLLSFIRSVAIGGLQIWPSAQLAILALCEIMLLCSVILFKSYALLSLEVISAVFRLCSVLAMVSFLPDLVTPKVKDGVGYFIILLHTSLLVFGYLFSAIYHLWNFLTQRKDATERQIFGLSELERRATSHECLPENPAPLLSVSGTQKKHGAREGSLRSSASIGNERTSPSLRTTSSQYFRPPRSPSYIRSERPSSSGSHSPQSPSSSASCDSQDALKASMGQQDISLASSSVEHVQPLINRTETNMSLEWPKNAEIGVLSPRWNDLSFREADLYFKPHPRRVMGNERIEQPVRPSHSLSTRNSITDLWRSVPKPARKSEKGFQIIRP
ncbi:hypothetical protein IQ07DRAFT_597761 [Pyrenochaeta sp. DS3sAY3a]|nr:hypothetical protein IQ07DRAFT_597761 [Pyrenochaeta sp. DS3sAY3a]